MKTNNKWRVVMAGLLAVNSWAVSALTIGDIDVHSHYGAPFSARIPLTLQAGEDISQGCVRLNTATSAATSTPHLVDYRLALEPVQGGKSAVLITTQQSVTEPTIRVDLVISCGQKVSSGRQFIVNQKLADVKKR